LNRKAFTLIELLVVIAIIAILAAILFPVFAKAREQARKSSCLNNEKQIGLSVMQYAQDYDETMPATDFGGMWATSQWSAYGWGYIFKTFEPYIKSKQVFTCPSANVQNDGDYNLSYGYSEYIYDTNRGKSKLASLANGKFGVAQIVVIAESRFAGIFNDWDDGYTNNATYPQCFLGRIMLANNDKPRHEGSNVMYADGHAKFIPVMKFKAPASNGNQGQYPIVNPDAASELN